MVAHHATIDRLFRRDPEFLADPYPVYHELRDTAAVLWVDGPASGPPWLNAWHVFAYDVCAAIWRRDERLSSPRQMAAMPLEHFGIDPNTPAATFFWTMQTEDWASFKRWSDGIIGFDLTHEKLEHFHELGLYLRAQIEERRARPQHDLITAFIAARDQDDALSEDELVGQCIILLVGGHETTTYALGNAVYRLLAAPSLWERLPQAPIESTVDELLRCDSPFQALSRRATATLSLGEEQASAEETVWFWIAAANRDPARFAAPDTLDLARQDNRRLSFGLGPHYCLGAALARLEMQIALTTLRQRYPGLRLATNVVAWRRDGAIRGPQSLRVMAA